MKLLSIIKNIICGPAPKMNLIKTFVFNYKLLPLKQAVKLPIFMYGKWNTRSLKGKIIIDSDTIESGMFKFGFDTAGYFTAAISTLSIHDNATFHIAKGIRIGQGVQICVFPKASLILKDRAALNDNVKVICSKRIEIGVNTSVTWECQIMDYNSHYVLDMSTRRIASISKPVILGDYCWICNRTIVMPGTVVPNRIIVASGSLLNRDYIKMGINEKSLIGGSPAKLIKEGVYRLYKKENYKRIQQYFNENPEATFYTLLSDEKLEE